MDITRPGPSWDHGLLGIFLAPALDHLPLLVFLAAGGVLLWVAGERLAAAGRRSRLPRLAMPGLRRPGRVGPRALLSPWEASVLPALVRQCPAGLYVCPQAHVGDFLLERGSSGHADCSERFRGVRGKVVDFLVVDAAGAPVLVVELDDRTHRRPDRALRDRRVEEALREAGVPIARFRPGRAPDISAFLSARER